MKDYLGRRDNDDFVSIVVASNKDNYESVGELSVTSLDIEEDWVMDSGLYYHVFPINNTLRI